MSLEDALRDAEAPSERHAEERAWAAVAAAHAAREPVRRGGPLRRGRPLGRGGRLGGGGPLRDAWPLGRALALASAVAAFVAVALTPPGDAVADWIKRAVDPPRAVPAPRALALPGAGRLLVEVPGRGLGVLEHDGQLRQVGRWGDATWSPRGLFIAATRGRTLAALDPRGRVRWRVTRPEPVAQPGWSNDGFKVAYRSGGDLRLVAGDGTGDRLLVAGSAGLAAPAWQPGKGYALAWADRAGRVRLLDVFTGRELWRSAPGSAVRMLRWSRTGSTVAAVSGKTVRVLSSQGGHSLRIIRARGDESFEAAAFSPRGSSRLTLVRHDVANGGSRVTTTAARAPSAPEQPVFAGEGRIADLTYSPDGEWLLLGWRGADQWLYLRSERVQEVRAVSRVTRQLAGPGDGRWAFPAVRGWAPPAP